MGVFGAVFGCSGDAGFSGALLGVCSGVVGFNVAMVSCLVREKVRPAALCHRESAKKFAQRAQLGPTSAFLRLLASFFAGMSLEGLCWVSFFAPIGPASVLDAMRCTSGWLWLGGLRHAKPSGGASPACRRLGWRHSPGWWRRGRASRWCGRPNCRPPRPLLPIYIVFRRGGLRFGQNGVVRDVLFAREPAIASLSPLYRT